MAFWEKGGAGRRWKEVEAATMQGEYGANGTAFVTVDMGVATLMGQIWVLTRANCSGRIGLMSFHGRVRI